MVVYSVLSNASDTQYVRVYTTYNPPANNPANQSDENQVRDAVVTLSDGVRSTTFLDTTVTRPDKSRYPSDIKLSYIFPFRVEPKKLYSLTVSSPTYGTVSVTTVTPDSGEFTFPPDLIFYLLDPWVWLRDPGHYPYRDVLSAGVSLSAFTRGYRIRYVVYFQAESFPLRQVVHQSVEIPVSIRKVVQSTNLNFVPAYPVVKSNVGSTGMAITLYSYMASIYNNNADNFNVQYDRGVFYLYQYDAALTNYYETVSAYQDPHTVRSDNFDYTNIPGGAGVFGSLLVDSLVVQLPLHMNPPNIGGHIWAP